MTANQPVSYANMPSPSEKLYDSNYLTWKSWGSQKEFGRLTEFDEVYFATEIKRTGKNKFHSALEIGFGNGQFLAFAKKRGWEITGVEANSALVEIAKEKGFKAIPSEETSGLADNSFDLIAAFDVLEHIEQERLPAFLRLLKEKLKPGGLLMARFPNGDSPLSLHDQNADITHKTMIGSGKIKYLANLCGLNIIFIKGSAQPILCGDLRYFAHRILSAPFKFIVELFVRAIFFPQTRVNYTSKNLTVALGKPV